MRAGQDWCLECGTAAPGRLGARPGWRAGFTVIGLTLLLLTGAVAASYAALTGDAQRDASRASAGDGAPIVAPTPGPGQSATPVKPGATGPGTTAPPAPAVAAPQPPQAVTNTPQGAGSDSSAGDSSSAGTGTGAGTGSGSSSSGPQAIKLSASTYDPDKRAGAEFGPAANAVDGSRSSVWDVTVPVDNEPLGTGLLIDLGVPHKLESLKIDTPMQGFDVELYGAKGPKVPPDILDGRWEHLTDRNSYADGSTITLKGRTKAKLRYVALWFTQARNDEDPRVAIADVTVTGTK